MSHNSRVPNYWLLALLNIIGEKGATSNINSSSSSSSSSSSFH